MTRWFRLVCTSSTMTTSTSRAVSVEAHIGGDSDNREQLAEKITRPDEAGAASHEVISLAITGRTNHREQCRRRRSLDPSRELKEMTRASPRRIRRQEGGRGGSFGPARCYSRPRCAANAAAAARDRRSRPAHCRPATTRRCRGPRRLGRRTPCQRSLKPRACLLPPAVRQRLAALPQRGVGRARTLRL